MAPSPREVLHRLESADLDALIAEHPTEWQEVGEALVEASKAGPEGLRRFVAHLTRAARPWSARLEKSQGNPEVLARALPALASARMGRLAVERMLQSAATGVIEGHVRLGLWSGFLVQRLLFRRGLERKAASLGAFRLLWPLVFDRRKLMPLVQEKGIYCFFTAELIDALARRFAGLECLEVAAGDGTLSRLLAERGVAVQATDDHSWERVVTYPAVVERLDARAALERYPRPVVLCCFPPPGNAFEKRILASPHVRQYLVITTRQTFAAGDWEAYRSAEGFSMDVSPALSALVLPPEVDPCVVVLERR